MLRSRILLIVIALVLAGTTTVLTRTWLRAQKQEVEAAPIALPQQSKSVLVSRHRLARGSIMNAGDLVWRPWPEAGIDGAYIQMGTHPPEYYAGWVVRDPIGPGEPLTEAKIVAPGSRGFLAAALQPGMRAISVAVTATNATAGFIAPGDHVDLLVTLVVPVDPSQKIGGYDRRATETVLENVRVIAIDQKLDTKAGETVVAHTATLEVTPKDAEKIALASEVGKLSLVLRSLSSAGEPVASNEGAPTQKTAGDTPDSHTYDSDVVRVLPKFGPNGDGTTTILRGAQKQS